MDTIGWRRAVENARGTTRPSFRKQRGLTGTVILFVGQLRAVKGVPELLTALDILAADPHLPPWSALFVGSGPLAPEIEAWAEVHPSVPVVLPGFVQPGDLAKYYASADLFVMPSLFDQWALVCIEALVAGIPQVTSLLNGGTVDLVTSSEVGAVVDPRDARSLASHLADRVRLGPERIPEALRDRAMTEWSAATMVERAMSSIHSVIQK
jgi:glycosyltransferase involved in cell wall biosynthesis